MDSLIELQRQSHEDIERFERALSGLLSQQSSVRAHHIAADILDRTHNRINDLANTYDDTQTREHEIQLLSGSNDLSAFYARLSRISEHHAKYPSSNPGVQFELETLLHDQDPDDEYADEDRSSLFALLLYILTYFSQPLPSCSPAKRRMGSILICMQTMSRTQT